MILTNFMHIRKRPLSRERKNNIQMSVEEGVTLRDFLYR